MGGRIKISEVISLIQKFDPSFKPSRYSDTLHTPLYPPSRRFLLEGSISGEFFYPRSVKGRAIPDVFDNDVWYMVAKELMKKYSIDGNEPKLFRPRKKLDPWKLENPYFFYDVSSISNVEVLEKAIDYIIRLTDDFCEIIEREVNRLVSSIEET